MEGLRKNFIPSLPPSSMPMTQELTRAHEAFNAQIAEVKQAECEAEEAQLWAGEEARMAAEQAWREEEEWEWECARLAEEARV